MRTAVLAAAALLGGPWAVPARGLPEGLPQEGASLPAAGPRPASSPDLVPRLFEAQAAALEVFRPGPPLTRDEWPAFRDRGRARHAASLGIPLEHAPSPVAWRAVGAIPRKGYEIRKVLFESRPGLPVPAHLYVPSGIRGRVPAVLNVHGHWAEAKNAPQVQSRCAFLALRGYVVLALDAIGAGERAYQGITYHGRQLGYGVLPSGLTLAGLQVLDNRRAIDLLQSMPEVDPSRIGVTGASGGGNQTFHLAILDERVQAAMVVCSYGAYAGYLRGAHCACELVPGVLGHGEEGEIAGLAAPRSLTIVAAKEDQGAAFRIEDARRNAAVAARIYAAAGAAGKFRLLEFEGGHDYSRGMREAMVAWFDRELKGIDSGDRVEEPPLELVEPVDLRVLGPEGLPAGTLFVPRIAADRAAELIRAREAAGGPGWSDPAGRGVLRGRLVEEVLGGFPTAAPLRVAGDREAPPGAAEDLVLLGVEPGVDLPLWTARLGGTAAGAGDGGGNVDGGGEVAGILLVLAPAPGAVPVVAAPGEAVPGAADRGVLVATLAPRGIGPTEWPAAATVGCRDYLLAQGSSVLGRPILGQWAWDALRAVDWLLARHPGARVAVCGEGELGLAALLAGALDDRIAAVGAVDMLSSWEWADRFDDRWGLAALVPGVLRLGDVAEFAASFAGRSLLLARPRDGGGKVLDAAGIQAFRRRAGVADAGAAGAAWLRIEPGEGTDETMAHLRELLTRALLPRRP